MRRQAKWFHQTTMMALFAVVALLVSPALALNCCCATLPAHQVAQTASALCAEAPPAPKPAPGCCPQAKPSDAPQVAPIASTLEVGAVLQAVCDCESALDQAVSASVPSSYSSSFVPFALALPVQPFALDLFVQDVRLAAYAHHAAQPRSPDRTTAPGRAPPVLALS